MLFAKIIGIWILAATALAGWRHRFDGKETRSRRVIPPTDSRSA
jgi:hypothetical protein